MKLTFLCLLVSAVQISPFLLGHLMPAFVAAPVRARPSSSAASPKSAQKGQLTRGRRGERAEEEEKEKDQWERDAAPRRQDLSVNEGHCARMETSNGKPKLLPSSLFLLFSKVVVVVAFSLTLFSSSFPMPLSHCSADSVASRNTPGQWPRPVSRCETDFRRKFLSTEACLHVPLFRHVVSLRYFSSVYKNFKHRNFTLIPIVSSQS